MTWDTFIPDLVVVVFGSVLTILIAYIAFRIQRKREETAALRGLIDEIHHRRSVTLIAKPHLVPNAESLNDFRWATSSVLSIRERIRDVRNSIGADAAAQQPLSRMTRATNRYLETTANNPDVYVMALMELRSGLREAIVKISNDNRRVTILEPGEAAL